jgi:hypothetical protein
MWFEPLPGRRLWLVKQRQLAFAHDAESNRLAQDGWSGSTDSCEDQGNGFRGWLGGLLVSAGRAIERRGEPCNDPCPDVAFR